MGFHKGVVSLVTFVMFETYMALANWSGTSDSCSGPIDEKTEFC